MRFRVGAFGPDAIRVCQKRLAGPKCMPKVQTCRKRRAKKLVRHERRRIVRPRQRSPRHSAGRNTAGAGETFFGRGPRETGDFKGGAASRPRRCNELVSVAAMAKRESCPSNTRRGEGLLPRHRRPFAGRAVLAQSPFHRGGGRSRSPGVSLDRGDGARARVRPREC
ncbi:hypothetical protein M885DRAFT_529039 [Pelagophyceae sp. CCMP2097]|nr:hypothetical protein M885DRAFT_529039 [Pelagophyceae sp. CCMP2097]